MEIIHTLAEPQRPTERNAKINPFWEPFRDQRPRQLWRGVDFPEEMPLRTMVQRAHSAACIRNLRAATRCPDGIHGDRLQIQFLPREDADA